LADGCLRSGIGSAQHAIQPQTNRCSMLCAHSPWTPPRESNRYGGRAILLLVCGLAAGCWFANRAAQFASAVDEPRAAGVQESDAAAANREAAATRQPILIDTDIGSDIDDAFALALALASPQLELLGVTACAAQAEERAWIVSRFLTQAGYRDIPIAAGRAPQPDYQVESQIQYRRHPAVIFNRTARPAQESASQLMARVAKERPGQVTLVALGPLTNVARLLDESPEAAAALRQIVWMGGALRVGYSGRPPAVPEWNCKHDVAAARKVLASGIPVTLVPLDATASLALSDEQRQRIFAAGNRLTFQVQNLYELWEADRRTMHRAAPAARGSATAAPTPPRADEPPVMHDAAAVAVVARPQWWQFDEVVLHIDDSGQMHEGRGPFKVRVARWAQRDAFLPWLVERLVAAGPATFPAPPGNRAALVDRGAFPHRVHVVEDYETDIERRWWMVGVPETDDLPGTGRRACRGVLTLDFDDRMGDTSTAYRAVIFNPVPGPPMGRAPRLAFRYKLRGADTLRIQLYSLTNGYHRYLSLSGLPQDQWHEAAVDLTAMRRPDGSGGPLSEDERIDDIQFYVDPRAELLIDDIVLYDAALAGETRPFPQRIVFTAWFDTGRQGQEWPGAYAIVPHAPPRTWKFARTVEAESQEHAWIRLSMRGARPLEFPLELSFRYRLQGQGAVRVGLFHDGEAVTRLVDLPRLARDQWSEHTLSLRAAGGDGHPSDADQPKGVTANLQADEIRFLLPRGSTLDVDDVLLYVPAPQGHGR
jgi:purine nucleosidase